MNKLVRVAQLASYSLCCLLTLDSSVYLLFKEATGQSVKDKNPSRSRPLCRYLCCHAMREALRDDVIIWRHGAENWVRAWHAKARGWYVCNKSQLRNL